MSPPGKTGNFPRGKLHPADEGEICLAIAADPQHGIVVVDFGTPVRWLGMPPEQARQLAATLFRCAQELEAARPPLPEGGAYG